MYLPIVTWLTGIPHRAWGFPAVHPWRGPCRRVSGDGMRVEPSLMHHEGGSWTAVRTHTPSKLSKVQRTFVSHPLGLFPSFGRTDHSPLRTGRDTCRIIRLSGFLVSSTLADCLAFASVLDNVEDRFGCSHLAYLCVLSMGNLPHFAIGVFFDSSYPSCGRLSRPPTTIEAPSP